MAGFGLGSLDGAGSESASSAGTGVDSGRSPVTLKVAQASAAISCDLWLVVSSAPVRAPCGMMACW
jgi:hypothetical protein